MEVDVNKIANIIADIQTAQDRVETSDADIKRQEAALDDEREYNDDVRLEIRTLRDELTAYLDELIPEVADKFKGYESSRQGWDD